MREGGHLVEILLGPFVERVVVALGALETGTEKDAYGVRHVVQGHASIPEVIPDGPIALFKHRTRGGHQFSDEFIISEVLSNGFLYPVDVGYST